MVAKDLPTGNKFLRVRQTKCFCRAIFCEVKCINVFQEQHLFPTYSLGVLFATDVIEEI